MTSLFTTFGVTNNGHTTYSNKTVGVSPPPAGKLTLFASNNTFFALSSAGVLTDLAAGGATTWDTIGDAAITASLSFGATAQTITSTLDDGNSVLTIQDTDIAQANATPLLRLKFFDSTANANSQYLFLTRDDGAPVTDYSFAANLMTVNVPATFTGTFTVPNQSISYTEMQNVSAASKLLGRGDSGAGAPQEITLGSGLSMTGTTISSSGGASDNGGAATNAGAVLTGTTLLNPTNTGLFTKTGAVAYVWSQIAASDIDWALNSSQYKMLTANTTFTFSNTNDNYDVTVLLQQDAAGTRTVTWPPNIHWLSSTNPANAVGINTNALFVSEYSFFRRNGTNFCRGPTTGPSMFEVDFVATQGSNFLRKVDLVQDSMTVPMGAWFTNNLLGAHPSGASSLSFSNVADSFEFSSVNTVTNGIRLLCALPISWDAGVIRMGIRALCTGTNDPSATNVVWGVRAAAIKGGEDATAPTYGTSIAVTNRIAKQANTVGVCFTRDITIGNTPAATNMIAFEISRLTADAGDTLTNSGLRMIETVIYYKRTENATWPVPSL